MSQLTNSSAPASPTWDRLGVVSGAILVAVTGTYALSILPLFVGSLAEGLGLTDRQLGVLASADLTGMALSASLAVFYGRKINWRWTCVLSFTLMLAANYLSMYTTDFPLILVLRLLSGFGGGMALSIGMSCQGDNSRADRVFGFFIAGVVFSAIVSFLLMPGIMAAHGVNGVIFMIVVMAFCGLLSAFLLPSGGKVRSMPSKQAATSGSRIVLLALAGLMLFCISMGGTWAYVKRLGELAGLSPDSIGVTLGFTTFVGFVVALSAAWLIAKLGRARALLLVALADGIAAAAFLSADNHVGFVLALGFFQLAWMVGIPLILALINVLDFTGKAIVMSVVVLKVSYAVSPVLLGSLIQDGNYTWMMAAAFVFCAAGSMLSHLASRRAVTLE